jgi:hypothetical protein
MNTLQYKIIQDAQNELYPKIEEVVFHYRNCSIPYLS